jgi:hypothetical protein
MRLLWAAFGIVFTLNLFAAVPPSSEIGALLPVQGALGIVGSLAMIGICVATLALLVRGSATGEATSRRYSGS